MLTLTAAQFHKVEEERQLSREPYTNHRVKMIVPLHVWSYFSAKGSGVPIPSSLEAYEKELDGLDGIKLGANLFSETSGLIFDPFNDLSDYDLLYERVNDTLIRSNYIFSPEVIRSAQGSTYYCIRCQTESRGNTVFRVYIKLNTFKEKEAKRLCTIKSAAYLGKIHEFQGFRILKNHAVNTGKGDWCKDDLV